MKLDAEFFIRGAIAAAGLWCFWKGCTMGFVRNKDFLDGGIWRIITGAILTVAGFFILYFSDVYPPLTDLMKPLATFLMNIPGAFIGIVTGSQPVRF